MTYGFSITIAEGSRHTKTNNLIGFIWSFFSEYHEWIYHILNPCVVRLHHDGFVPHMQTIAESKAGMLCKFPHKPTDALFLFNTIVTAYADHYFEEITKR